MSVVELVVNGDVVASAQATDNGTAAEIVRTVPVSKSSWIAARVWGPSNRLVVNDAKAFAHTSPVYCYVGGQKIASAHDAKIVVAWIDGLIRDVAASPRFATPERRNEILKLFRKGRAYYHSIAERQ
jgi:hypothetical protein